MEYMEFSLVTSKTERIPIPIVNGDSVEVRTRGRR